MESEKK